MSPKTERWVFRFRVLNVSNNLSQPKYIGGLLASASTRKLDYLRAEEKLMQREREAEGDEFADKESFVTQAYKDQMAAVRAAEEEEKKRDGMLYSYVSVNVLIAMYLRIAQEARRRIVGNGPFLPEAVAGLGAEA